MKSSAVETMIGAAVVAVAAGFFLFAYQSSGKGSTAAGLKLSAMFDNASGISIGTDIRIAGVKVGTVTGFTLDESNFQAVVTMQVDPRLKLTEDATAKVTAEGLLGSNFITLEQGGADTILADGGTLSNTQGAVDIWSLISQAMFAKSGAAETPGATTEPQAQ